METPRSTSPRPVPAWFWLWLGGLAGDLGGRVADASDGRDAALARAVPAIAVGAEGDPRALDPAAISTWTVRELRTLPGIGPARAVAIAEARWSRDRGAGPLPIDAVRGIGPRTWARIDAALSAMRAPPRASETPASVRASR